MEVVETAAALHASSPAARYSAVGAMASLMRTVDAEELKSRGVDPAATLIEVARKETRSAVLYAIHGEMSKEDIPPDVAEPILGAVHESPYLKSHEKKVVANDIVAVRRRREAAATAPWRTVTATRPTDADSPATQPAAP